ncbi:MAG: hypothetical protein IT205_06880 [Fimbriimonadaceae bacterium]|nr:hypothetical protein [Fimbriimonadaceae bacterium]
MASHAYNEIVERLPKLNTEEVWALLGDLQALLRATLKKSIGEFEAKGPLTNQSTDWVREVRGEWDA